MSMELMFLEGADNKQTSAVRRGIMGKGARHLNTCYIVLGHAMSTKNDKHQAHLFWPERVVSQQAYDTDEF